MFSSKYICYVCTDDKTFSVHGPYTSLLSFNSVPTYGALLYIVIKISATGVQTIEIGGSAANNLSTV